MRQCGLVRDDWRASQTSNAYGLMLGEPPRIVPRGVV